VTPEDTLPDVAGAFRWVEAGGVPALRCMPLDAVAPHLFTTRNLDAVLGAASLGVAAARVWQLTQVHGDAFVIAEGDAPEARPEADALISNDRSVALVVRAADCVPLLMADTRSGAVAAVHAGWRGTAARVAPAAVKAMGQAFGTRPQDIVAAIGPAIAPCCYEVGPALVDAFAAAGHERHLIDRWFQVRRDRKLRLDVPGANRDQLVLAGVPEANVHVAGLCTAMNLDVVTSYRAEKERAGRIAGVIRRASA
jgi:YfiH family protein